MCMLHTLVHTTYPLSLQEDAHEYLRQLIDCMHEEIIKHNRKINSDKSVDKSVEKSSLIQQIFGGTLCNMLACNKCGYKSKTYNSFQVCLVSYTYANMHTHIHTHCTYRTPDLSIHLTSPPSPFSSYLLRTCLSRSGGASRPCPRPWPPSPRARCLAGATSGRVEDARGRCR
ncbi:hypothetical protein EON63_12995 [archaeon]|nr:MAG: hypothetical protein EON63_12995 [archaeon]